MRVYLRISIFLRVEEIKKPSRFSANCPMETFAAPIAIDFSTLPGAWPPLNAASASAIPSAIEIFAPPRIHYAPSSPGIQQSRNGDLSLLSFDVLNDYLSLSNISSNISSNINSGIEVSFELQNSGVAAADSFTVDIVHSEDDLIGNSDDSLVERLVIDAIAAQDTLMRTVNVQVPADSTFAQGSGFFGIQLDTNNRVVETNEENNTSSVLGVGIDSIIVDTESPTYTPSVAEVGPTFSNFEIAFSESVTASASNIESYRLEAQSGEVIAIGSIDRLDAQTASINLSENLTDGEYTFSVLPNVSDLAGNSVELTDATFSFEIQPDNGGRNLPDESVLTQGGSYSTNLGLNASFALSGTQGVDVVLTEDGAIAAVNTETGSSLHWIDPETGAIAQQVDFADGIKDIAFDENDTLAIAAGNSLLTVDSITGETLTEQTQSGINRVAISKDGFVGAIAGRTVLLYDTAGELLFSKTLNYKEVTDLEIRSVGTNPSQVNVYVTSFRNEFFTDIEGKRNPVQIAKLEAFDATGTQQWSLFGDESETIKQNVADTRLYRTTLGKDGYLYIGGESAGTATIFRWRGQPMTEDEQFGRANPILSRIDQNSQLYNSGAAHIAYYARVNPITGQIVNAQVTFPRLNYTGRSNTFYIGDIATNANGNLHFGGTSFSFMRNRNQLTINDQAIGTYSGQDPAWMSIAPDFSTRNFWTALSEQGTKGSVTGVDSGYGYSAAISNINSGTFPVTFGPNSGSVFVSFTRDRENS